MDIIILSAVVLGITQAVKITTNMDSRFVPLTSILVSLGVFSAVAAFGAGEFNWELIQAALIAGLTAGGLWSGTKSTLSQQ